MIRRFMLVGVLGSVLLATATSDGISASPGLQVNSQGVLIKDGKPYRGIGINYFNVFLRRLKNPDDNSYREGLKTLSECKVPFIRFAACGYWPVDFKLYREDKEAYFKLMDGVVKAAEEYGIGLIPSLFWYYAAVPDIVGEPMCEWANPKSKTIAFARQYVREIVERYKDSPAIWGWECGNEWNLHADLPNASEHRAAIWPNLGTASVRSEKDDLTHKQIRTALSLVASEIRKYDKHRLILSGNAFPRPSAWHQQKERSWKADSEEQYGEMLKGDNPSPVDTISVHLYRGDVDRFGRKLTLEEFLLTTINFANQARKPVVIGEFGGNSKDLEEQRKLFYQMMSAIERTKIPLAVLWVYDLKQQSDSLSVTTTNERAYQLRAIRKANERISQADRKSGN